MLKLHLTISWLLIFFLPYTCQCQSILIKNDPANKILEFGNEKIHITLDYNRKVNITGLAINGQKVIEGAAGVYSEIRTKKAAYSTLQLRTDPSVSISGDSITLSGIVYGDMDFIIKETWKFFVAVDNIRLDVDRSLSKPIWVDQAALPAFTFNSIGAWEGAYQGYGGLAWFYLFNKQLDTYGVHSRSSRFWNSKTGNGLSIAVRAPGEKVAMTYSRTGEDKLAYSILPAEEEMLPRFDSGTHRRLFLRDRTDVWAPFLIPPGKTHQSITLSYFDFNDQYGRGKFKGINGEQVSAVLNTIARIGVIDKQHFGGNSWHTPYGPICLHEQYIAQMGLGINDPEYTRGYQDCLDFYRDNAIKPDGRVWPRWAYNNEDIMPGQVTDKGFYEAQWGYLLDANPDLVTNVAELYDQTGDLGWVRTHQQSCEKALDWICKRDTNDNGLVEMMTDSHLQKRGSDWIDIIWASYENAFVNAKLYHALVLWASIERQLGNLKSAEYYDKFAGKLKISFNKPVADGGFWDEQNTCFIHWRDKDGSIHGNNMVTPVNFMAIGYDICDNEARKKAILDKIETRMQQEKLFFWPICLESYNKGEGNDWQFPFPRYENGDIFLSWGALGVKAYASYKPAIALQYVKNVLAQYAKDGLAFQRYGRAAQDGLGDDILAGNSLSVVGLYQAIYGINPLYNRFYLNPHLTSDLAGTQLTYYFRNQRLSIGLSMKNYSVSNDRYKVIASKDFGFYSSENNLWYFDGANSRASLKVTTKTNSKLTLEIGTWGEEQRSWGQSSEDGNTHEVVYHLYDLKPNSFYAVLANGQPLKPIKTLPDGSLQFTNTTGGNIQFTTTVL